MDKSDGQAQALGRGRSPASTPTQDKLLDAAAELIAELGWGRVSTRAVADRAGVPHGSVSYHFAGKQDLLTRAALRRFDQAVPFSTLDPTTTIDEVFGLLAAQIDEENRIDPVLPRLMLEAMREADRDAGLRTHLAKMLAAYRSWVHDVVRSEQQRGVIATDVSPESLATLLGAIGDGLLLHALLDPELDPRQPLEDLRALLGPRTPPQPNTSVSS